MKEGRGTACRRYGSGFCFTDHQDAGGAVLLQSMGGAVGHFIEEHQAKREQYCMQEVAGLLLCRLAVAPAMPGAVKWPCNPCRLGAQGWAMAT